MTNKYKPIPHVETSYDELFADGHYEEAIAYMQSFLVEHKNNPYAKMIAHINIASCYYYLNKIGTAYEHVLKYKELCLQHGNQRDHYNLYHISALIYEYEQHYDKAELAIQECIQIAQSLNLQYELAESYNLYSQISLTLDNLDAAMNYAIRAQEIIYTVNSENLYLICQIHCNLTATYIRLGKFAEAHNILQLLAANPYTTSSTKERSLYLYSKGYLQVKAYQYESAVALFNEALQIAQSCQDKHLLRLLSWDLAHVYEEMHNYEAAFQTMRMHSNLSNELLVRRNTSNVADIHLHHNIAIVEQRANIDALSGVYNRSYLEKTCTEWLQQAKQTKTNVCCLVFDVDNFKHINDNYGHLYGDEVIKKVGQICAQFTEPLDGFTARFGGDEFVIILRNLPHDAVFQKCRELFEALSNICISTESGTLSITVSMGMVCNQSIIANRFAQIFKVADQALYMAKKQGKNQIVSLSNHCSL